MKFSFKYIILSMLFLSCGTHKRTTISSFNLDVDRNLVEVVQRDTLFQHEVLHIHDSVRIKDSTVIVVDTVGKVIREFRYIHEYVGKDTNEKINSKTATVDSTARIDSVRFASIEKNEVVVEKKCNYWKLIFVVLMFVIPAIVSFILYKKLYG